MSTKQFNDKIDRLFCESEWAKARFLLERQVEKEPDNHWVLTQIGVTFYEEHRYDEALKWFLTSAKILPDCPLTLWNVAGTYDALGQHSKAIRIYNKLLECPTTSVEDPCWESQEWTDVLKADCVYRLGRCYQSLGTIDKAEQFYRRYIDLFLVGIDATYPIEEVMHRVRELRAAITRNGAANARKKLLESNRRATGGRSRQRPAARASDLQPK